MASKKESVDRIGFWSLQKLDILGKYLPAYSRIMCRQGWCPAYYYVDAFTGTINPQDKETEEYLAGSPIRALETKPPFTGYYFIEKDNERFQRAKELANAYPDHEIYPLHGDCNEKICEVIIPMLRSDSRQRALVFLDPYGLNAYWSTVQELAETGQCDVFINFPVMGVIRNLPLDQQPDKNNLAHICNVFGDDKWYTDLYTQQQVLTLLNGTVTTWVRTRNIEDRLVNEYIARLHRCFSFVSTPKRMVNSKSATQYMLMLASQNKTAIKIMNDIFKIAEREPAKRPSSKTAGQGTLF
jgi:three-Cys-motif partner protein